MINKKKRWVIDWLQVVPLPVFPSWLTKAESESLPAMNAECIGAWRHSLGHSAAAAHARYFYCQPNNNISDVSTYFHYYIILHFNVKPWISISNNGSKRYVTFLLFNKFIDFNLFKHLGKGWCRSKNSIFLLNK